MGLRRPRYVFAVLLTMSAAAFAWTACSDSDVDLDEPITEPGEVTALGAPCASLSDCYREDAYVLGSECINGRCDCPQGEQRCGRPICDPNEQEALNDGILGNDPFLDERCRPSTECDAGCDAGPPPPVDAPPPHECEVDADCAPPSEPRCGEAHCNPSTFRCEVTWKYGALPSQKRGDCKRVDCNALHEVVAWEDPGDIYDDGWECTIDVCENGQAIGKEAPDGTPCMISTGYCLDGKCVQCLQGVVDECPDPMDQCHGTFCEPGHCANKMYDPVKESATDCGGACAPCPSPSACAEDEDCFHGVCIGGTCAAPSLSDGVKNDGETDVDCGGATSKKCVPGQGCHDHKDCDSDVCWGGFCVAPTCFDGTQNQDETKIDCGGMTCAACPEE